MKSRLRRSASIPRRLAVGLAGGLCLGGLLTATSAAEDRPGDLLARVGDVEIRSPDVDVVLRRLRLAELTDIERQRAAASVLEQIIDEQILRAELRAAEIEVPAAEIDAALAKLEQQVAGRGMEFEAFLAQSGRTAATVREQAALEIGLDRYVRPRITPAAVAGIFEGNRRELDGTRLRISHIVLRPAGGGGADPTAAALEQAKGIRQEILQGRLSFAEAARRHSAAPSRRQGGDIGWIRREGPLIDAFSGEVFALPKGGVSEPFVTPFGVHVATVTGIEPGSIRIDAVRARLEKMLAAQLVRDLVLEGRRKAPVEFAAGVPHFDPATVGDPPARRPVRVLEPSER